MNKTVAVHQPNFLPWLGFFHKWCTADTLIVLDQVQLVRRTYLTRVDILERGEKGTIHIPVTHTGDQALTTDKARIDTSQWKPGKLMTRLQHAYGRAPFWSKLSEELSEHLHAPHTHLLHLNLALLKWVGIELLGLEENSLVLQSTCKGTGQKSQLMATLTQSVGGTRYLSGGHEPTGNQGQVVGAAAYNDPRIFEEMSLELTYQNFTPRPYPQSGSSFIPGLSVLDALFWMGVEHTRVHLDGYGAVGK